MHARTARSPLCAVGLTAVLAAALAGCAAAGPGTAAASSPARTAAPPSPQDAVQLAAKTTSGASSFTGTISLQATAKSGATGSGSVSMTATMAEQVRPSLQAEVQIGTLSAAGSTLPGPMTELITPSNFYLKWSFLTQEAHLAKPWLVMPVSALSKSTGVNLSQIFSQATGSGPLTQSQLLQGATSVRQVGTGSIDGVAVTEYTGTFPLEKSLSYLSGSAKTEVQQAMASAGFSTATFTVWIDGQHITRKAVVTEVGKSVTETITTTITSINQPVNIAVPTSAETDQLSGSELSGLS